MLWLRSADRGRSAAELVRRDVVRKRLRKKQRLGEFQEFGFRVRIVTASGLTKAERDWLLLDGWVLGFVEASGLLFGGGGLRDWDGYVTSAARRGSAGQSRPASGRQRRAVPTDSSRGPRCGQARP